jgi:ADP-ribose pyrophosphatase YjhB (NUDIX family)
MPQNPNWLDDSDWKWVQDTLPIACCDVVPVQMIGNGQTIEKIGLIYRDTPHQGMRWCMVGGRMYRNESMAEAATRQLRETLGPEVQFQIDPQAQPDFVVQYFTSTRPVGFLDPRQHAITLAFVIPITGKIAAMGEAASFQWFDPTDLPPADEWGFSQNVVVQKCIQSWLAK